MVTYMRVIIDECFDTEIKDYLLGQDGILNVELTNKELLTELKIKYNNKINPKIIMKYIDLFQDNKYPNIMSFDKEYTGEFNTLKYVIKDMCCEYCYEGLVMDLFQNDNIKSVKSNFDFKMPPYNIEFIIEYKKDYKEQELIDYINEKYS